MYVCICMVYMHVCMYVCMRAIVCVCVLVCNCHYVHVCGNLKDGLTDMAVSDIRSNVPRQ